MVVKVLSGGAGGGGGFGGIDYNEEKKKKGDAQLLEKINIDGEAGGSNYNAEDLKDFFEEYSSRNPNVSKPQFHVAFSVKGNEMSHEDIAEIAKKWMAEMGYAEPGQPMVIYAHQDTGNNHVHIITSRVAPDGHKINHNHERRRGREIMNRLMGERKAVSLDKNTEQIMQSYRFSSVNQFMAIFQSSGYEAFTYDTDVVLKRDGVVREKIPIAEINNHLVQDNEEERIRQKKMAWRAGQLLMKIAANSSTKEELAANARKRFGIGIIWLGKPEAPYGYMVVDHKNKMVFNGSNVCKLKQLQDALTPMSDRLAKATSLIEEALELSPEITTREMNYRIAKEIGGRIIKGILTVGSTNSELPAEVKDALKTNDRFAWVNSFNPSTEIERDVLCKATGIDESDKGRIKISPKAHDLSEEDVNRFREAYRQLMTAGDKQAISKMGLRLIWEDGVCYGLDFKKGTIADLNSLGISEKDDLRKRAESILSELINSNPDITTRKLNRTLISQTGCRISKGVLMVGKEEIPLSAEVKQTLKTNDRIEWANSFKPSYDIEREVLRRSLGIDEKDTSRIKLSDEQRSWTDDDITQLQTDYKIHMTARLNTPNDTGGRRWIWEDGVCFCIDFKNGTIANLNALGIANKEDLRARAEIIVMELANSNPEITTRAMNDTLIRETGCRISKGFLMVGKEQIPLSPDLKKTLKTNDRIEWANSFKPSSDIEREIVRRSLGIDEKDTSRIKLSDEQRSLTDDDISRLRTAYMERMTASLDSPKTSRDMRLVWEDGVCYCIDFKNRTIDNLNELGIANKGDLRASAELIVMELANSNPEITTRAMNKILMRHTGCRISKGFLIVGKEQIPLSPDLKQTLKTNDRIEWANSFKPSSEAEKEILHRHTGVDREKINLHASTKLPSKDTLSFISDIYRSFPREELQAGFKRMGLKIEFQDGKWYCVDFKTTTIVDLKAHGFDTSMLTQKADHHVHSKQEMGTRMPGAFNRFKNVGQGGVGQKRDWEVGRAREYSDEAEDQSRGMSR